MEWISGVKRDGNGELCIEVQDQLGRRSLRDLETFSGDLHREGDLKKKITVRLDSAVAGCTLQYLAGLGLPILEPSGQSVYEFEAEMERFVIPSQLLILSILGIASQFRATFLRPYGVNSLITAFHDGKQIRYEYTPHRATSNYQLSYERCHTKLQWFSSFPSAGAAWSSIYRNALDGMFDMRLPKAKATLKIDCRRVDGRLLATRVQLMNIEAMESPYAFIKGAAISTSFSNGSVNNKPSRRHQREASGDPKVAELVPSLKMNDSQWACVDPILSSFLKPTHPGRGAHRVHSTRLLMDAIFFKVGTPVPWAQLPFENARASASLLLSRLQTSGTWDKILDALQEHAHKPDSVVMTKDRDDVLKVA